MDDVCESGGCSRKKFQSMRGVSFKNALKSISSHIPISCKILALGIVRPNIHRRAVSEVIDLLNSKL